jgi:hypothetical protein
MLENPTTDLSAGHGKQNEVLFPLFYQLPPHSWMFVFLCEDRVMLISYHCWSKIYACKSTRKWSLQIIY